MKLIKSYSFWTALAGAAGMLAVSIAKLFNVQIEAAGVEEVVMAVCGVLIVFGIVTKPDKEKSSSEQSSNTNQNSANDKEQNSCNKDINE